jgi:hypothetical protein
MTPALRAVEVELAEMLSNGFSERAKQLVYDSVIELMKSNFSFESLFQRCDCLTTVKIDL